MDVRDIVDDEGNAFGNDGFEPGGAAGHDGPDAADRYRLAAYPAGDRTAMTVEQRPGMIRSGSTIAVVDRELVEDDASGGYCDLLNGPPFPAAASFDMAHGGLRLRLWIEKGVPLRLVVNGSPTSLLIHGNGGKVTILGDGNTVIGGGEE